MEGFHNGTVAHLCSESDPRDNLNCTTANIMPLSTTFGIPSKGIFLTPSLIPYALLWRRMIVLLVTNSAAAIIQSVDCKRTEWTFRERHGGSRAISTAVSTYIRRKYAISRLPTRTPAVNIDPSQQYCSTIPDGTSIRPDSHPTTQQSYAHHL